MPRDLCNLPGAELGKYTLGQCLALFPEPRDLVIDIDLGIVANKTQLLDFSFEFSDRLFKFKEF